VIDTEKKKLQRDFVDAWERGYRWPRRRELGVCQQCKRDRDCVLCGAACGWDVLKRVGVPAGYQSKVYQEYLDEHIRNVAVELERRRGDCERNQGAKANTQTRRVVMEGELRKLLENTVGVPVAGTDCKLQFADEGRELVKAVSQAKKREPAEDKKADIRIPVRDLDKGTRVFIECKSATFNDLGAALLECALTRQGSDKGMTRFGLLLWEPIIRTESSPHLRNIYDSVWRWNDMWRKRNEGYKEGLGAFDYVLASDPVSDPGFQRFFNQAEEIGRFLTSREQLRGLH